MSTTFSASSHLLLWVSNHSDLPRTPPVLAFKPHFVGKPSASDKPGWLVTIPSLYLPYLCFRYVQGTYRPYVSLLGTFMTNDSALKGPQKICSKLKDVKRHFH